MNAGTAPRVRRLAAGLTVAGALAGAGIGTSTAIAAAVSGPAASMHSQVVARPPVGTPYPCYIDGRWWTCIDFK